MLTFTLAISCLTTSNLPWFMDLTFQVPMQYCSLQHQTLLLSPVPSTTGFYFRFGSIPSFFLELFLHWSPVAYWAPTYLGSSSFRVLSFCLFMLFIGSQGRNTEVICHSLLQRTTFCQPSLPWSIHFGGPTWLGLVSRVRQDCGLWSDLLVVCDCVFSLSAPWCPLSVPTILLGFLLPWTWGISSQLLQQRAAAAPYLGHGVALHSCSSKAQLLLLTLDVGYHLLAV